EEYALDSNDFFALEKMPKRLVIVGAGYIAAELAGTLHG
ncbi:FAD-dependent oxidoreductase, partial [Enterococcus faecalis]|nr:FAD-dependent oxidoreductase [Enterococcus faecalis]